VDKCTHCGYERETVEHFLLECEQFYEERCTLRSKVGARQMTMASLLGNKEAVKATLEYVVETARFSEKSGEEEEGNRRQDRDRDGGRRQNSDRSERLGLGTMMENI
jgi:hypothetical protein